MLLTISIGQTDGAARANGGGAVVSEGARSAAFVERASAGEIIARPRESASAGAMHNASRTLAEGLWPLAVVLALICGGAVVARRAFAKRGLTGSGDLIRVMSRHYLSPKQSICLIRIGSRVLAVGVTPDRISPLCQIDDGVGASRLVGAAESGRADSMSGRFQAFLSGASSEFDAPDERRQPPGANRGRRDAQTAVRKLRESLRGAGSSIGSG